MPAIPDSNRIIARTAAAVFGGTRRVTRYWDDDHRSSIDLLSCVDSPQPGVTTFATVTLSNAPLYVRGKEYETRLELVGAVGSSFQRFDNALTTAAFCISNSQWSCYPGALFPDVLAAYDCSPTMRHMMFVPPFLWDDLHSLELSDRRVAWLLAVPISEPEYALAQAEGSDHLEDLLERAQIDLFDLHRPSVV